MTFPAAVQTDLGTYPHRRAPARMAVEFWDRRARALGITLTPEHLSLVLGVEPDRATELMAMLNG